MKYLIAIILLTSSPLSFAGCDSVILGGFSHHMDMLNKLNEKHPAIGVSCGRYDLAVMRNSHNRVSFAFARNTTLRSYKTLKMGYKLGFATNYAEEYMYSEILSDGRLEDVYTTKPPGGIMPVIQMTATYKHKQLILESAFSVVSTLSFKIAIN